MLLMLHLQFTYCKIPIISPGLYLFKRLFCWAYFPGSLFSEGLIIGRNFAFQNGFGLTIKTAQHTAITNSLKQLKTVSTNSPWAYIREGLFSEGLVFFLCFLGGGGGGGGEGGGGYYRNFTVDDYFICTYL